MPIEIRETTITPAIGGTAVQLHISDAEPDDENATFVLTIQTTLAPIGQPPLMLHLQREAISKAQDVLMEFAQALAKEITEKAGKPLRPTYK